MEPSSKENREQCSQELDYVSYSKTCLTQMHTALTELVESFETPNTSNINKKVKLVESRLETFKLSLDQIPGIDNNLSYQEEKIKDLKRCIELKKELINRLYLLPKKLVDVKPGKGVNLSININNIK
uniref:Mediator of RNA polymerase II transcription subunit 9 n=1 Tax=Parastrongyloides trichosuri TaxID=131310 RepID=A0A0N4ZWY1_PARTI